MKKSVNGTFVNGFTLTSNKPVIGYVIDKKLENFNEMRNWVSELGGNLFTKHFDGHKGKSIAVTGLDKEAFASLIRERAVFVAWPEKPTKGAKKAVKEATLPPATSFAQLDANVMALFQQFLATLPKGATNPAKSPKTANRKRQATTDAIVNG